MSSQVAGSTDLQEVQFSCTQEQLQVCDSKHEVYCNWRSAHSGRLRLCKTRDQWVASFETHQKIMRCVLDQDTISSS